MTTLEASTQAYLKGRNISLTSTAVDQAKDAALTSLKNALRTGDPVDAQAVAFLMDYFNDSDPDIATLRSTLYGSDALMDGYVITQKRPMTDALTPLMMSAQFAPDIAKRDATVLAALRNGNTMGGQPPVQALAMLATLPSFTNPAGTSPASVTGKQAAAYFAEQFISKAAASGQAVPLDLLNTYIAFNPLAATAFLDGVLVSHWTTAHDGLLDAYRQLNPLGANSPVNGVTTLPGDLNSSFDTDPPAIKGWSWFALQRLIADTAAGRPLDEAMLRQLNQVNPFAAAYAGWMKLADQLDKGEGFHALSLEVLAGVKPDLAKAFALTRLEQSFGVPNALMQVDANGIITRDADGLTNDTTPTFRVDLNAMGKALKAGDKLQLYIDETFKTELDLTAESIARGWIDITSTDLSAWQGAHSATMRIKDGVTGALSEQTPGVQFTLDSTAATVIGSSWASTFEGFEIWIEFDSASELASVSKPTTIEVVKKPPPPYFGDPIFEFYSVDGITVDAVTKRIKLNAPGTVIDPHTIAAINVGFSSISDVAGNTGEVSASVSNNGRPNQEVIPRGPTTNPTPTPPPPQRMLDHSALIALQNLDAAAATKWRDFYTHAGLLGTAPAPAPAPATGNGTGTSPPLTAEELLNLDLETLVYRTFMGRFDAIDDLLKQQLASVQKINEDMAKLSDLLGAVNGLVERIPADTAPSKRISEIDPKVEDASDGTKINAAIAQIPGLILFDETKGIPAPGQYNRGFVTKGGLLAVQTNLKAKLDSMSNMQQHETLRTQMMNSKRLECLTAISNLLEAANNCKKEILRNLG